MREASPRSTVNWSGEIKPKQINQKANQEQQNVESRKGKGRGKAELSA